MVQCQMTVGMDIYKKGGEEILRFLYTLSLESNAIYLARSAENVKLDLYDKL